jgi:transposase-like protein
MDDLAYREYEERIESARSMREYNRYWSAKNAEWQKESSERKQAVSRSLKSGHSGPVCRSCGERFNSHDSLPRKTASHDDQITTTYCPSCGSENIY